MTNYDIATIIAAIDYRDWIIEWQELEDHFLLTLRFQRTDAQTGEYGWCQNMRPWIIEKNRSEAYVVGTVYGMIKMAEDHETAEHFLYKGKPIFSHHNLEHII